MTHHITDEHIGQIAEQVGLIGPASRVGDCHAASLRFARALLTIAASQSEPVAYRIDYTGLTDTIGLRRWCGADEYASSRQTIEFLGGVFVPLHTAPAPAVPSGWKLVPVEPTEAMLTAGALAHKQSPAHDFEGPIHDAWSAMLKAAPTPPAHPDDAAVDRFVDHMNAKLAARAAEKGGA